MTIAIPHIDFVVVDNDGRRYKHQPWFVVSKVVNEAERDTLSVHVTDSRRPACWIRSVCAGALVSRLNMSLLINVVNLLDPGKSLKISLCMTCKIYPPSFLKAYRAGITEEMKFSLYPSLLSNIFLHYTLEMVSLLIPTRVFSFLGLKENIVCGR